MKMMPLFVLIVVGCNIFVISVVLAHRPLHTGLGIRYRSDSLPALAKDNMTMITGRVHDKNTGNPMRDVNIFVQGTGSTTHTDTNGNFTMRVPVHTVITISHVGYVTERTAIGVGGSLDIALRTGIYHIPLPEVKGGYYASTAPTRAPRRNVRTDQGGYAVLEQMPNFAYGGYAGLALYLREKGQKASMDRGQEGNVNVGFTLSKSGSVSNVHIIHSDNPTLNEQAVDIIKAIEGWIPGEQRGRPVDVRVSMMIRFSTP